MWEDLKVLYKLFDGQRNNAVRRRKRSRSKRQSSRKTYSSKRTASLDRQLAELTKAFIPSKRSIRKTSNNAEPPTLPQSDEYWAELSTWYREQNDWTCEQCNLDLSNGKQYLDTHHMLGRGYNSPEHLQALCIGCHAEQRTPVDHRFMKNDKRYWRFVRTYR